MTSRRKFIRNTSAIAAGVYIGGLGSTAKSYGQIKGANDRIRVGVVGFSDRFKTSLLPSFLKYKDELNMDIVGVSDIWKLRREEGQVLLSQQLGHNVQAYVNNEAMYEKGDVDAVIISTADFQHALHTIEAIKAGCDVYVEKPFAETMDDNIAALKAVKNSKKIVQIGSQRRSGENYKAAADFKKLIQISPSDIDAMFSLAKSNLLEGNLPAFANTIEDIKRKQLNENYRTVLHFFELLGKISGGEKVDNPAETLGESIKINGRLKWNIGELIEWAKTSPALSGNQRAQAIELLSAAG